MPSIFTAPTRMLDSSIIRCWLLRLCPWNCMVSPRKICSRVNYGVIREPHPKTRAWEPPPTSLCSWWHMYGTRESRFANAHTFVYTVHMTQRLELHVGFNHMRSRAAVVKLPRVILCSIASRSIVVIKCMVLIYYWISTYLIHRKTYQYFSVIFAIAVILEFVWVFLLDVRQWHILNNCAMQIR